MKKKQNLGQYYTRKHHWFFDPILEVFRSHVIKWIVDPFAGEGHLLEFFVQDNDWVLVGLDIDDDLVRKYKYKKNDSLKGIPFVLPKENVLTVTNPPYKYKSTAKRQKNEYICEYFKDNDYTNLYQLAIEKCLNFSRFSVIIVPETFLHLRNNKFEKNIIAANIIENNMFNDTEVPVVSVLLDSEKTNTNYGIYRNRKFMLTNNKRKEVLDSKLKESEKEITFNNKLGQIFLRGIDGTGDKKIKFFNQYKYNFNTDEIKSCSRSLTIINIKDSFNVDKVVEKANKLLEEIRRETSDTVLSPFMGNDKLGIRRRRLDFKLAKKILKTVLD